MTITINGAGTGAFTDASGNFSVRTATATSPVTVGRVDSANEGGQIDLCRASDNSNSWGIDVYGNTSTPSLRFIDNVAASTRASIDGSGNFAFNSGYGSAATAYGCRAWVSYNGTGTPAIRGSANVSSVTRSTTGIYIANLTSAMPDTNYAMCVTGGTASGVLGGYYGEYTTSSTTPNQRSTSAVPVYFQAGSSASTQDNCTVSIAVFR
jgi:hypothetical protein